MNKKIINEALNYVDDDLIMESIPNKGEKSMKANIKKIIAIAACAAVVAAAVPTVIHLSQASNPKKNDSTSVSDSTSQTTEDMNQVVSPYTDYSDISSVNEAAGTAIKESTLSDITEVGYNTIDNVSFLIAQYSFDYNGISYTVRAAKTEDDISGIYVEDGTISAKAADETIIEIDGTYFVRWFENGIQYNLFASDTNSEAFNLVYESVK
jgi:hypothetical protein